jgi:hypothetical protein
LRKIEGLTMRKSNVLNFLIAGLALCLAAPASASAASLVSFDISGTLGDGIGAFSGVVRLAVTGGQATSGSGFVSGDGFTNVPIVLITTATPGNEATLGPDFPVGFRANDGTDLFGADTAFPLDSAGLLFDVGTKTAAFGEFPLLNLFDGGSLFDGKVDGTEFFVDNGTLSVTNITSVAGVPEPATWAMMLFGVGLIGAGLRVNRHKNRLALSAA